MQDLRTDAKSQKTVSGADLKMRSMVRKLALWIDKKLQRKLVLILAALLFATSTAFLAMVIASYKTRMVSEHARASMQVNRLLQASLENAMLKRDIPGLRKIVGRLGHQKGIASVTIINPDFEVRFSSDTKKLGKILHTPTIAKALKTRSHQTSFITSDTGRQLLRSVNPVHNKPPCKTCHGPADIHPVNGLLIVDYDSTSIRDSALKSALLLGLIGAIVVLATGVGIWIALNQLVVARLQLLNEANHAVACGDFAWRVNISGSDEIAELASSFDTMAERLDKTIGQLHASETFLQSVIDSIPDGIRVIDDDFTIIKANRAYCEQTGRAMGDVIGQKCYKSSHGRNEPCPVTLVDCPVAELKKTPDKTIKARHQHFNDEGSELFVEVSAARVQLTINGKTSSYVVESIRDLAEQAKISQEQRLSEIGQLATGVAHEIHNPLSSILFALKAMQGDIESSNTVSPDYLEIAEGEISKCLEVTDRLLMLSLPPDEGQELIDVASPVRKAISLLSFEAEHAHVAIHLRLDDKARIIASDGDIGMIVINLAQNALHAMPKGGDLTIGVQRQGNRVVLTFSDTGEGIARRNLEKIFLPFWTRRADASSGSGLGLSICKAIIDRLGGEIRVDSTVGKGTTFTISLPDADSERQNP